jgi:hypothetical protein
MPNNLAGKNTELGNWKQGDKLDRTASAGKRKKEYPDPSEEEDGTEIGVQPVRGGCLSCQN